MLALGPLNLFEKKINDAHQYKAFMCPLHAQNMHKKTQLFFSTTPRCVWSSLDTHLG